MLNLQPLAFLLRQSLVVGYLLDQKANLLIRQAYIDGFSSLATASVCVLLGVAITLAFFYLRRRFKNTADRESVQPFGPLMGPVGFVILGMVLLLIIAIGSDNFYWVVSDFYDPEFYALRHLPFSK